MGGILGLWNRDGRPVDAALLSRLRDTLSHRRGVQTLAVPGCGDQPSIAFDGRLDNRDELVEALRLSHDVSAATTDDSLVLAAYQSFGDDVAARLAGDFAFGLFDPARRTLLLARDALGVRPLHYYARGDLLLFASEIKAIVAHPDVRTRPNDDVLADYLLNLLAADDRRGETFFQDVFSVMPSHLTIVTSGTLTIRRYWDFDPSHRLRVRSIEDAADGFRDHFTRAVRRRLRSDGPVAVSVSGGLDSSAVFCVAERLRREHGGPRLHGVSYAVPDGSPSDEKAFLVEIERMYGVRITQWGDLPSGLLDGSREGIRHFEAPMLAAQWNGTLSYYRSMRALGATTILTGHWGDQFLVADEFLIDLLRRGAWRTAWSDIREYRRWKDNGADTIGRTLLRALVKELLPGVALSAARRLRDLGRADHDIASWYTPAFHQRARAARRRRPPEPPPGSAHARALYRLARSRYYAVGMEWNNKVAAMHGMDAAFPFLDRDLIAYLMAIPGELLTWRGVPKGLMREALRDVLPEAIVTRRSKADFSQDVNTDTANGYDKLVACLRAGNRAAAFGYMRRDALSDAASFRPSPEADTCSLSWALTGMLSLELWLEEFFGHSTEALHHAQGHAAD